MEQTPSVDPSPERRLPVGREPELARIREALRHLSGGEGQTLLICGEPGIGKSTLAQYIADQGRRAGLPVYWGFCWEAGEAPAYWPWTQLLRALLKAQAAGEKQPAGLGQVLPEYTQTAMPALQAEQARFALMEAVREILDTAAANRPLILLLEDLHTADPDSLQLLHYIARHIRHIPILLAGTFRDSEARNNTGTEPLWRTARDAELIKLSPLTAADVGEYLEREGGTPAAADQVHQLYSATEGNPLFLTELVTLLGQGGLPETRRLPESLQQVLRQQLDRLPQPTRQLLAAASILGREFGNRTLAELAGIDYDQACRLLQPATAAGIVDIVSVEGNRFSHILYCDVLRSGLELKHEEQLHRRRARLLEAEIAAGSHQRWSELAGHLLAAGADQRPAAVSAWRRAAELAAERQALAEAARSLAHAWEASRSIDMEPAQRCRLALDCARASMVKGDIRYGQQLCSEAFDTATAIDNPQLMAEAALTSGSVFVAARVDPQLIDRLERALGALPAEDSAGRARVAARLAGARQPAANPQQPVDMALEAIALARGNGDDRVIYEVLQSAISALMDFYPARERAPLNREFGRLAEQFDDIPGRFRSHLRCVIDACELADRTMLEQAAAAARQIADRIKLPHYQWWVASLTALSATIDGDFAAAAEQLSLARELANKIDDKSAQLAIPLQRMMLLEYWQSPDAPGLEAIRQELAQSFEALPNSRLWVRPWLALLESSLGEGGLEILDDRALIEQVFADGDRLTIGHIGELACQASHRELVERAYDALLPFADVSLSNGLMGPNWAGPVARFLGIMAAAQNRTEEAERHFQHALSIAEDMACPPLVARIHEHLAALADQRQDPAAARHHAAAAERLIRRLNLRPTRPVRDAPMIDAAPAAGFSMQREGDVWRLGFGADSALIKQSKGMAILATLVDQPNQEIHVLDLAAPASSGERDTTDSGPLLDDEARAQYRQRVAELQGELEDAQSLGDIGRSDALQEELDFISRELSRAFGLGGRRRAAGAAAERARVNVQRRLRDAIKRIEGQLPAAGRYLNNTIKTGTYCQYRPM